MGVAIWHLSTYRYWLTKPLETSLDSLKGHMEKQEMEIEMEIKIDMELETLAW